MPDANIIKPIPSDTPAADPLTATPTSTNAQTAGNIATSNSSVGYTTATKVGTLKELKERAPKVYQAMMQGIATSIINDMKDHAQRLKKLIREGSKR